MKQVGPFDYVIVGGGSAGCVLANRLSVDPACRVLLLEAGGHDRYIWIHIPVGYLYCMNNPRTDWGFSTEPQAGLNGRALSYPRGKVLGGCSSINGMIYMRGQAADYDQWRQLGNAGWGWDDVLPYFRKSEDNFAGADEMHGAGGEWRVERQRLSWKLLDAFRDAAEAAGIGKIEDFNRGDNEGSSYFRVNQKRGLRWNAVRAFLRPAMRRPNLTVLTGARVTRIAFEGRRATGIAFDRDGAPHFAAARREVVLSAGAVGSPHLLQVSGIGPGGLLAEHGVAVVGDLPGVGANLQDHLQLRLVYRVQGVATLNERAGSWHGKAGIAMEYAVRRTGPMSMAPSQLGAFARSGPAVATADLQYHVQPLSLAKFGEPLDRWPGFTASVCHLRPHSRGTVRLRSPDPSVAPAIQPNYLSDEYDRGVAVSAIRLTRTIAGQAPLARYRPEEVRPGPGADSDEALRQAAGDIGTTIFHAVGTARMGSDPMAVVDDRLRVHGVEGLRVVDASVMPTITSGNTNSPTIMIAEKAADLMLGC